MLIGKKKGIGILGGSFDPPHKGHLKISNISLKKIKLKKIYWIVTKKNPFKKTPHFSLKERILRCHKITQKNSKIKILYLDDKIKSNRSIDAINYLSKIKKHGNLYLILGSDNLINFHKWKSWKKLVKLTKLVVFSRKGYDRKGKKSKVSKYLKNKIIFIKNKPVIISSTRLRKIAKLT